MRYASASTAALCVRCPRGSFCADGIAASPCPDNCTTAVNGADSALMCIEAAYSIAEITYFIASPIGWERLAYPHWPPYVSTRSCSLLKAASGSEFTCTVSMPKCVADAVFQWWVELASDARLLNVTGFRAAPRIRKPEEIQQAEMVFSRLKTPVFVVEPRKWGQTRSQYFMTLWAMSGVVFGMFVVSCWMCLLLHLRR